MPFSSETTALGKLYTTFRPPPIVKLLLIFLSTTLRIVSLRSLTYLLLLNSIACVVFETPLSDILKGTALTYLLRSLFELFSAGVAFLVLHPGSLPANLKGFLQMVWIAQFHSSRQETGYLGPGVLTPRPGQTPYATTDLYQNQLTQSSPPDVAVYLSERLALFASTSSPVSLRTETVYIQPQPSGNLHVILHPADFDRVIASGWGEAHSRAGKNVCVPRTMALVYAPREYGEVCGVMRVVEAGARFLGEVEGGGGGEVR
ncbi:hypothetical protein WHR41_07006 [Cladosporium halotolerans]|uniref:Luciferase domain-containing protein n=1 Tax=Cladosporium halotolerans TaxID=1052096 RepID=A0AB34KM12_9PEZI